MSFAKVFAQEFLKDMPLGSAAREEIETAVRHAHETGQVVQAHHMLMAALKRHGLMREADFGLSGPDIHDLTQKVAQVGWDDREKRGI